MLGDQKARLRERRRKPHANFDGDFTRNETPRLSAIGPCVVAHDRQTRAAIVVAAGSEVQGYLGYAYAKAGRLSDVEALAARIPAINPFNSALISAGLGDKDRCFEALQRAVIAGPGRIGWALGFPEYAILRGDPRMTKLRTQAGCR